MTSFANQVTLHLKTAFGKPTNNLCFGRRLGTRLLDNRNNAEFSRFMSSDDANKNSKNDTSEEKSDAQTKGAKSSKKLNDLLQTIIKDTASREEKSKYPEIKLAVPEKVREPKPKKNKADPQEVKLGKRVLAAVKKVAESVGGDPVQIESELVNKLKSASTPKSKLSDIFEGMRIEPQKPAVAEQSDEKNEMLTSKAARVHRLMDDTPRRRTEMLEVFRDENMDRQQQRQRPEKLFRDSTETERVKINLFGARPLGIFTHMKTDQKPVSLLKTWDALEQKELKMLVTHPPSNGFEEMILWTDQKKLWEFPINNEQGLDEEAKYSFEDHVFLDNQIESWCPPKGPVRNFMELVCVGLSKNSYLTVPEKREFIAWYHDYFKSKSAILKQTGAGEVK